VFSVDLIDAGARARLISQFGTYGTRGLVATEGLLVYLTASQVAALASELAGSDMTYQYWPVAADACA